MTSLQELKHQAEKLSVSDRLKLIKAIVESLQKEPIRKPLSRKFVEEMIGMGKGESPPPTDAEVEAMREERLVEKYLK